MRVLHKQNSRPALPPREANLLIFEKIKFLLTEVKIIEQRERCLSGKGNGLRSASAFVNGAPRERRRNKNPRDEETGSASGKQRTGAAVTRCSSTRCALALSRSKFEPELDYSERELAEMYRYKRIASNAIHGEFRFVVIKPLFFNVFF